MGKPNIAEEKLNIDNYSDGDFDSDISKFEGAIISEEDLSDSTIDEIFDEQETTAQPVKKGSRGRPKGCNPSEKYKATIKNLEEQVAELKQQLLSAPTTSLIVKEPIIPESINHKLSEELEAKSKKIQELEAEKLSYKKAKEIIENELMGLKNAIPIVNPQPKQEQAPKAKFSSMDKGTVEYTLYKAFVDEGYDISMDQVKDAYRIIMNVLIKLM